MGRSKTNPARKTRAVNAWVEVSLVERLHRFVEEHSPRTTITATIEAAIREYLDRRMAGEKQPSQQG